MSTQDAQTLFCPTTETGREEQRERERMSRASGIDRYVVAAAAAAWVGSSPKRLTSRVRRTADAD